MGFKEELQEAIQKSKLSLREISRRCQDDGKPVSQAYISKVLNGDVDPPSEAIIRSISSVINTDPVKLIWSAYIEKAPDSLSEALKGVRDVDFFVNNAFKFFLGKVKKEDVLLDNKYPMSEQIYEGLPKSTSFEGKLDLISLLPKLIEGKNVPLDEKFIDSFESYLKRHIAVPEGMFNAPILSSETIIDGKPVVNYKMIDKHDFPDEEYFYFIVEDDSLISENIFTGYLVLNKVQKGIDNGKIHIVGLDSKVTFRRIFQDEENYILQAANPDISPVVKKMNEFRVLGKVVYAEIKLNN